jgi:voltage-gated potassium channel Kch
MENTFSERKVGFSPLEFRKRNRFLYFLISMTLLIIIAPLLKVNIFGQLAFSILSVFVLISSINSISKDRKYFLISCLLGAPWIAFSIATTLSGRLHPEFYEALFGSLFFVYVTVVTLSYVLKDQTVTADTLYGAICVYILLGITWSFFCVLVEAVFPGAFSFVPENHVNNILDWPDFIYYSFVTLTTLGYGDITPITQTSRNLAFLEAVSGQVYLAIIVARLVAMYISHSYEKRSNK